MSIVSCAPTVSHPGQLIYRGQKTTLLTNTTAMACPSWSLPAGYSCPGATKDKDSPCGHCYASQGMYLLDTTARAQWIRFQWTRDCLKTAEGRREWIGTMAEAMRATGAEYFRWHDSGDLFSPTYVRAVAEVCRLTPKVRHWLATQSFNLLTLDRAIRENLVSLANVVVRPSVGRMDAFPPRRRSLGYAAGATVYTAEVNAHKSVRLCPKSTRGGSCASNGCRLCWNAPALPVGYLVHGIGGKGRQTRVTDKIRTIRSGQRNQALAEIG